MDQITVLSRTIRRFLTILLFCGIPGILLSGILLSGCAGMAASPPDEPPQWVIGHLPMPGYYVGIGSSNSGDMSEDRIIAENRAMVQVGGEISTQLRSELRIETTDEALRGARVELFEETTAIVEQDLTGVEIVDTYYHPNRGYWVLARLSKERWAAAQEHERVLLRERVTQAVRGAAGREPANLREELERLSAGWELLLSSPHGSVVQGELYGTQGYLADAVSARYRDIVSGLSVVLLRESLEESFDAVIEISGRVEGETATGRVPVALVYPDRTGAARIAAEGVTDEQGEFLLLLPREGRRAGTHAMRAVVAAEELPQLEPLPPFHSGEAAFRLTLIKPPARLLVAFEGLSDKRTAEQGVRRFLADADLPVEIDEGLTVPPDGYSIIAEFHLTDFPQVIENAPLMSEGYLSFTVRKGDAVLQSVSTDSRREGGIDRQQAHGRVVTALIRELEQRERYKTQLIEAFGQ